MNFNWDYDYQRQQYVLTTGGRFLLSPWKLRETASEEQEIHFGFDETFTPLGLLAKYGDFRNPRTIEQIKRLCATDPNQVNQPCKQGEGHGGIYGTYTPLHYAAARGLDAHCHALLQAGADPSIPSQSGYGSKGTALEAALGGGHRTTASLLVTTNPPDWSKENAQRALTAIMEGKQDPDLISFVIENAGAKSTELRAAIVEILEGKHPCFTLPVAYFRVLYSSLEPAASNDETLRFVDAIDKKLNQLAKYRDNDTHRPSKSSTNADFVRSINKTHFEEFQNALAIMDYLLEQVTDESPRATINAKLDKLKKELAKSRAFLSPATLNHYETDTKDDLCDRFCEYLDLLIILTTHGDDDKASSLMTNDARNIISDEHLQSVQQEFLTELQAMNPEDHDLQAKLYSRSTAFPDKRTLATRNVFKTLGLLNEVLKTQMRLQQQLRSNPFLNPVLEFTQRVCSRLENNFLSPLLNGLRQKTSSMPVQVFCRSVLNMFQRMNYIPDAGPDPRNTHPKSTAAYISRKLAEAQLRPAEQTLAYSDVIS